MESIVADFALDISQIKIQENISITVFLFFLILLGKCLKEFCVIIDKVNRH